MEIDDAPMKQAIGELTAYATCSNIFLQEIENFLNQTDEQELLRFRLENSPSPDTARIRIEPGESLLLFLDSLRKRSDESLPSAKKRSVTTPD